jgi:hypothetical protein
MDFLFHLQQGQQLIEKQDSESIRKALEHFKKANEMTEEEDIGKPKILYSLALGNLYIGQVEQSYKIAHKAKRSIDTAIASSMFSMNNMRQMLGEDNIDALINHIDDKYPQLVSFTDIDDDDFDENELDFSLVSKLYKTEDKPEVKPQFSVDTLSEEVIFATFSGQGRTNDELIYFDKLKGNVLSHVQGYFSSLIGDQSIQNRRLANRITNNEPTDFVDEDRYILIDRLLLTDFLTEFKKQTNNKEPFYSFVDYFSIEVLKDFTYNEDLKFEDLPCSNHIQQKFHELFSKKHTDKIQALRNDYTTIFENTCKSLALNWIKQNVFSNQHAIVEESELAKMSVEEMFQFRRQCAKNRDIKSLLAIAKYRFIKGSAAVNISNLPEMCYYYGRLHRAEELKEFLQEKSFYLFMLPDSCTSLAENLLNIGNKFPHLNEKEISYLEEKYCDSKTFQLFDLIMFDKELLPREIKKFDKDLLKTKNTEFSNDFLLKIFNCFSKNEDLKNGDSEMFVYSRVTNKIICKKFEHVGLGEYCIDQHIFSNQFWTLMNQQFGEKCADDLIKKLSHAENWKEFKKSDFYLLNSKHIEEVTTEYFSNPKQVEEAKLGLAKFWLDEINSHDIELT